MDFSIDTIRAKLSGGGARPTLFTVALNSPFDARLGIDSPFMIKAASLPDSTIGEIEIGYMGRKLKAAGDRTYTDWEVTVINDENFAIRSSLENWSNAMQGPVSNIRNSGATSAISSYKAQANVMQYDKSGNVIYEYTFHGMFPKVVGAVTLEWDTENTIEEFTVTFSYDYFVRTV
jgi:hypothetical protein